MVGKIMLNPRQRNQIKAALTFWNAVAETSRVHPMEHPKVQQFFQEDLTSLIAGEIDDLIMLFSTELHNEEIATLRHIVRSLNQYGVSAIRLRGQLDRDGVESILIHGSPIKLYHPSTVIQSARKIVERDTQMKRKYRATEKPPSTSGDQSS